MQVERKPHAVLDVASRYRKARKIECLLGPLRNGSAPLRLLEVGCGNGAISHYFAHHAELTYQVDAVDVVDQRQLADGYDFGCVSGVELPYTDSTFDVVISNHVVEHVGDHLSQEHHLRELKRVVKRDGILYLAVPNRWMLVEPHYCLPFLSWLPRSIANLYVRISGRHDHYDCRPLTLGQCQRMLVAAGFDVENVSDQAMLHFVQEEGGGGLVGSIIKRIPKFIRATLLPLYPTLCFVASGANGAGEPACHPEDLPP